MHFPNRTFFIPILVPNRIWILCGIKLKKLNHIPKPVQVIGLYVGIATVGVFIIWYTHHSFMGIDLSRDGHSLVSYSQLANWGQCSSWEGFSASPFTAGERVFEFDSNPCDYFHSGKIKASTLSLSVLVAIEMFNSLNALSEDGSLLTMPPWVNPWLLLACVVWPSLLNPLCAISGSSLRHRSSQPERMAFGVGRCSSGDSN
jgi:hypothetical protein